MEKYDVAIIGAGPAGLEAARVLSQNGKKVIVLEKNLHIGKKVCAGGLTTKDFSLGIPKAFADRLFNEVTLSTPLFNCHIKSKDIYVATITREKLGSYLAKECSLNGVTIYTDNEVVEVNKSYLCTKDGLKIGFDYLVGTDGGLSIVRKYLGLESKKILAAFHYKIPREFKRMEYIFNGKLFGSGYAWIFPHKEFTSIGACVDPKFNINSTELQKNFKLWVEKKGIDLDQKYYESWFINYDYRGFQFDNIFLIGDAAGFASGLTGEGIYFAMVSGSEVAKKIINKEYSTPKINQILSIKEKHEKILRLLQKNKLLSQCLYSIASILFKTHLYDEKLVKSYG